MLRIFVLQFIKVLIIGMTIAILMSGVSHTILINYETDYLSKCREVAQNKMKPMDGIYTCFAVIFARFIFKYKPQTA